MKLTLLILTTVITTGCAGVTHKTQHTMRNPRTEQVIICKGDAWASWTPTQDAERCARDLEAAGWRRLGD